jgi:4-hydroxymandelate oxidase
MRSSLKSLKTRRKFLRMLAGSPLLLSGGLIYGPLAKLLAAENPDERRVLGLLDDVAQGADLISSPDQALDVMDFEPVARKVLPPAHFGYLATGVDDDATIRANREGFTRFQIRSRRLVDVSRIDMGVRLFDTPWETPIVICPVGSQKAFHPEGEVAVARAARERKHLQILSTVSSSPIEDVTKARGGPVWFQLYANNDWNVVRGMVKRAQSAGSPAVVITVDLQDGSNRETLFRAERVDKRECTTCHVGGVAATGRRRPIFEGLDVSNVNSTFWAGSDWTLVKRIKDTFSMKVLLKGIVAREDAELAIQNGVDGIVVSNHGGRAENTLRSTIESLPDVLQGVGGKIPVLVDSGFRRGTDAFKALALGATAIGIGRPYIWGLASFGQPGVEAVLAIMRRELQIEMREAGTPSIGKITRSFVIAA